MQLCVAPVLVEIDRRANDFEELSRQLWNHPELSDNEVFAHQLLTDYLERNEFTVERQHVLPTAFRATYQNASEPHVVVICEYDALPGVGHACGHNLIAEVGIAAGFGVMAALKHGGIKGKLTILGTPAEETHGGKIDLIQAGTFDGVDAAMMAHPSVSNIAYKSGMCLSSRQITYTGKASHAAGAPWEGINALDAAVTAYQSVSNLRQQMKPECRVHGIIKHGGERPNIIPEKSVMEYYIRAPDMDDLVKLENKVETCFKSAATATGCECTIELLDPTYSNIRFNGPLVEEYKKSAEFVGLSLKQVKSSDISSSGSTDMGNVSYVVPSIHPYFYIGGDGTVHPHSRDFTTLTGAKEAQQYVIQQAKALAVTACQVLVDKKLREQMILAFTNN